MPANLELADSDEGADAAAKNKTSLKQAKPKVDAKDPNRPRRKKARRACHACQRAHLTCGDERPCQRCIKRGLQNMCQDGQRKKAKYLHDAPENALLSGNNGYNHTELAAPLTSPHNNGYSAQFSPHNQKMGYAYTNGSVGLMGPPSQNGAFGSSNDMGMQMGSTLSFQNPPSTSSLNFIDSTDPAIYNFDLDGFQNQYGAFELHELGQMSRGAGDTPPGDQSGAAAHPPGFATSNAGSSGYSPGSNSGTNFMFPPEQMEWRAASGQQAMFPGNGLNNAAAGTYTIAQGPPSFASPSPPASSPKIALFGNRSPKAPLNAKSRAAVAAAQGRSLVRTATPMYGPAVIPKRPKSPSSIYKDVKKPYSYTGGFHAQTGFIKKRFSPTNVVRIAKAMASVRPSFISATKALGQEDLVFMEKCFQRTLYEYEDFINACGTPTIVCRRTGEIAAVGKEFTVLTDWKKDILLGREPNLNCNLGHANGYSSVSSDDSGSGSIKRPVLLAELLDDESVIDFYEDFAKLAFGDARGRVVKRCRLLKYRTEEDMKKDPSGTTVTATAATPVSTRVYENGDDGKIKDESGEYKESGSTTNTAPQSPELERRTLKAVPSEDGKVDCAYCWTIKRDVFDIPMLIVMNFLPCLS